MYFFLSDRFVTRKIDIFSRIVQKYFYPNDFLEYKLREKFILNELHSRTIVWYINEIYTIL